MAKRWRSRVWPAESENVQNPKIDAFLEEITSVCRKYGFSISHEDTHGAFEIADFDENLIDWLDNAHDKTSEEPPIDPDSIHGTIPGF